MAPEVGFEPTTNRLTADRSTTELLRIFAGLPYRGDWFASTNFAFRGLPIISSSRLLGGMHKKSSP